MIFSPQAVGRNRRLLTSVSPSDPVLKDVRCRLEERLSDVDRSFETSLFWGWLGPWEGLPPGVSQGCVIQTEASWEVLRHDSSCFRLSVCHGMEGFPFSQEAFDLICSSLVLHFSNDFPGLLREIYRCLKPGGLFLGVFVGGDTLREARHVLGEAESRTQKGNSLRLAPLIPVHVAAQCFQNTGFEGCVIDRDCIQETFPSLSSLFKRIKGLGQGNGLDFQWRHPGSRSLFQKAQDLYQELYPSQEGGIEATFELIFMMGWKPEG